MLTKIAVALGVKKLRPLLAGKKTYLTVLAALALILHGMTGGDIDGAVAALQNPDADNVLKLLAFGALAFIKAGSNRATAEFTSLLTSPDAITAKDILDFVDAKAKS